MLQMLQVYVCVFVQCWCTRECFCVLKDAVLCVGKSMCMYVCVCCRTGVCVSMYVCVCMCIVSVCVCVSVFIDGRRETSRKFSDQQKQQQTLPRQLNKSARESEMSGSKPANCHWARTIVFHFASLSRQASLSRGMLFNFPFD